MSQCNETFERIARGLGGFTCHGASAFVHIRNPLELTNSTLPVLEATMVVGAGLSLWWAIRRLHRNGDSTNLVLWIAAVVYLLAMEIPIYFPAVVGLSDREGVVFVHNAFTVQFLYERLPLYIVSLYPALSTLAYEIVRTLGIFRDRGIVIGALCVGFVHHSFYEVFDQLGPQLRWWQWNLDSPPTRPMFASVPMTSWFTFSTLGPSVLVLLVVTIVGHSENRRTTLSALGIAWRSVVAGALVPPGILILGVPSMLLAGYPGAQAVVAAVELVAFAAVTIAVIVPQWRRIRRGDFDTDGPSRFVVLFGPTYLGVLLALWCVALPAYFAAVGGLTADGTPVGSLPYAALSFVLAAVWLIAVATCPPPSVEASVKPQVVQPSA